MLTRDVNSVRYLNKNNNANERELFSNWWREQIDHYGTSTTYFTHGYNLNTHNFVYGEDPTSKYLKTENVVMLTDITNDSLMLSKFGIMADCDMTAVIHISGFYDKFGPGNEPKAGDLIQLTEYGADRPGGRSAPIYEITERDDEYLQNTNPLIGHYVWYIKCKRFEYSFEPGVPNNSTINLQVNDVGTYGRLPEGENPTELSQPYTQTVQKANQCIYDYYAEPSNKSYTYGYYGKPADFDLYVTSNPVDKFNITLLFKTSQQFTKEEEIYIKKAADYWASVLKDTIMPPQSIPDIYLHSTEEVVDNPLGSTFRNTGMMIVLEKFYDENSNVLAYAAPTYVRNAPGQFYDQFVSVGSYVTNAAKMQNMLIPTNTEIEPQYYWVALHEICHLLGISANAWQITKTGGTLSRSFYVSARTNPLPASNDIFYATKRDSSRTSSDVFGGSEGPYAGSTYAYNEMYGPDDSYAVEAYKQTFGLNLSAIPIENQLGEGSYGSHWHEGQDGYSDLREYYGNKYPGAPALGYELMTPISESNGEPAPVSRITLGALQDLGWSIDYTKAHTFNPRIHVFKGTANATYIRLCNYEKWAKINYNKTYYNFKRGIEYTLVNEILNADFEIVLNTGLRPTVPLTKNGNQYKFTIPVESGGQSVILKIKFGGTTKEMMWVIY